MSPHQQKRIQSKTEHRRTKLLEKDDQLVMVQALIDGDIFSRNCKVCLENEMGERVLVGRPKRMRPWYWMSGAGGCYFQVLYGSKSAKAQHYAIQVAPSKNREPRAHGTRKIRPLRHRL